MPVLSEAEGPALERSEGIEDLQANSLLVTPSPPLLVTEAGARALFQRVRQLNIFDNRRICLHGNLLVSAVDLAYDYALMGGGRQAVKSWQNVSTIV